jgi:hypothetical protein|tara:strand:+ start:1903 stop:2178 length:276 start_codon:yes stop_codon:yes gene_type:complete
MVLAELNLWKLFVWYTFGSFAMAFIGVFFILILISFLGKWSPTLRLQFLLFYSFATLAGYVPIFAALFSVIAFGALFMGILRLFNIAKGVF